ncbi:SDR family oxidoreductase [Streptomyces sp. NPDC058700]|uniref:SDR family oxidoreductase n=1 Tax=Streptomyces sp. NPDC058700 TaxID=3346607 RepID=UPI003651135B
MTMLIIGGSGFLGTELLRQASSAGRLAAATFNSRATRTDGVTWHHLDLRDARQIDTLIDAVAPSVVINASSGDADWSVTADSSFRLATATARQGIRLVHVSTDAVSSGADVHYDETALPDPVTPYGAAKAAAETAVRLLHPASVVARTSLIIGDGGSTHERVVHELVAGAREGALYTDDVRCPVHVTDLAAALWELAVSDAAGVFHLAGPDAVSRYALGGLCTSNHPAKRWSLVYTAGKSPLSRAWHSTVEISWGNRFRSAMALVVSGTSSRMYSPRSARANSGPVLFSKSHVLLRAR